MKKFSFIYLLIVVLSIVFYSFSGNDSRYPNGAPAGYTGSPSDGKDCTQCHGGTASNVEGWITSNIPESGYIPGEMYDITLTVNSGGKKGFEISPQSFTGDLQGTLHAVSGTKLVGSGKYITHSSKVSSNPAEWTFQWTAPAEETGNVVFYGAIAINESQTKLSSLIIPEDITAGIVSEQKSELNVFPNPVKDRLNISLWVTEPSQMSVSLYSLNGSLVNEFTNTQVANDQNLSFAITDNLISGMYLLKVVLGDKTIVKKVFIK